MSLLRRLAAWFERRTKDDELREELEFHLSEETDDRRLTGLTEDQARRAARRDLGNVTLVREDARAAWTWTLLEQLAQDVRYALRTMRRNPLFTRSGGAVARARHRRQHRHLQLHGRDPAPIAAGCRSRVSRRREVAQPALPRGQVRVRAALDRRADGTPDADGVTGGIFPYPAFERLREASGGVFSSLFA